MNPHRAKYHRLYWQMAQACADSSKAEVRKVGAVVVTETGLISPGWNGMPSGMDNCCEDHSKQKVDELTNETRNPTKPEVIHAERNAIDKMTREGVPTKNAVLFVTTAPCFECAKAIHSLGFKAVIFLSHYKSDEGIKFLSGYTPVFEADQALTHEMFE